jgi:uncharacterized delta-60 repeat protein
MKNTFTLAMAVIISIASFSQVGSLDKSFSSDGKAITGFGFGDDGGNAVIIQKDGKIVVAGFAYNGSNNDFGLARYNTDGSLDKTFGSAHTGKVITDFTLSDDVATCIALQKNGEIIVAGYATLPIGGKGFALARYNTNGTLDNTFHTNGKVITDFGGNDDEITSVAIQDNGKIVVAGYTNSRSTYDYALARYNANGSLDNTFGNGGKVITNLNVSNPGDDFGEGMALQSNGKIVVAGYTEAASGNYNITVVRYTTGGSLDNNFSGDGKMFINLSGNPVNVAKAIAIQPNDGRIVVAGYTNASSNHLNFALLRCNTNGTLDNSFSYNGVVTTDFGGADMANAVTIQDDGKIIVAGSTLIGSDEDVAWARYSADGKIDKSFSSNGTIIYNFGGNDYGKAVALQSNGKIVIAGFTTASGGDDDFLVARFHGGNATSENFASTSENDNTDNSVIEKSTSNIHIYPNPVKDVLRIQGLPESSSLNITITDLSGRVFQKATVTGTEYSFNLSMLKPGLYNINISKSGEIKTFRFLKQ